MFTGIVEELGRVRELDLRGDSARLTIDCHTVVADAALGDSIAVDGCCLTVTACDGDSFTADVMRESLSRTTLGGLVPGTRVNLERAVPAGGRLGGHVVQGHVDGVATIVARTHSEHWDEVRVAVPAALARYVALKGSIALDGVSLTVSAVGALDRTGVSADDGADTLTVSLIPTTLAHTTLGRKEVGDSLNVETDVLAKYVERLLDRRSAADTDPDTDTDLDLVGGPR
jgi:riboflavin synthase